ncbi:hypothetical protein JHN63_03270 [Streptomyces sp. MBT65]|uniref:hypothetical protein n=1 Tax=Streptomyces sp. MBT65 TaxID=1488395 RepID=UPI00190D5EC7|nr:hypothetical protein [Streptomyces sp. MBT65]MBK3572858.1 hypothetical protein [Streptomyces sp. MBT65]
MTVSPPTEHALEQAMERLLAGCPERTDGWLTKNNLHREADVGRATLNRAPRILAAWESRLADSPAAARERSRHQELTRLRTDLARSQALRRLLQDQVDAAATAIVNTALSAQNSMSSAVIVPFSRPSDGRGR